MQAFTFDVRYQKGSANIADSFSRLSEAGKAHDFDNDSHYLILAIMESAAVDTCEVEKVSFNDPELMVVRECVRSGKWDRAEAKSFEIFRNELGFVGDILVRGTKLVVPTSLRKRMLDLAHEGHPGETVMKRRLRDRVWWPGMDREVTKYVTGCHGCRLVGLPGKPEPMKRRELPNKPWVDIALDFMGPLPTGENLLVIVDYYSRYKEVEIMRQITAEETIARLHKIFTRLGFPVTITLDNARQFVSVKFENYCKKHGIHLNCSTPYWPQENGLVERQNRSLLKRLQISHALERNWKDDLMEYIMMYYTTPHSVTGKTPTEMCYGRTIRSKIPSLADIDSTPVDGDVRERDKFLKEKGGDRENEKRRAKESDLKIGDTVLVKNLLPGNKLTPTFNPRECVVMNKEGARVTIQNKDTKKVYQRNVAHLKRIVDQQRVPDPEEQSTPREQVIPEPSPFELCNEENQITASEHFRTRREVKMPTRFKDFIVASLEPE